MAALGAWWRRLRGAPEPGAAEARWVVVDCETSGLDVAKDRLLSIGAVAVCDARIDFADSHAVLLRQDQASDDANILIHGIGGEAQSRGDDPPAAIRRFADFVADSPCVAFHAAFDRAVLERAARDAGMRWKRPWLDVAELLPVLFAARAKGVSGLDGWLDVFDIAHPARHDAVGDAYATAQLFQVALDKALREGFVGVKDVLAAAASAKWMRS
jgi:DNA polymerase-3 subunit epsilon